MEYTFFLLAWISFTNCTIGDNSVRTWFSGISADAIIGNEQQYFHRKDEEITQFLGVLVSAKPTISPSCRCSYDTHRKRQLPNSAKAMYNNPIINIGNLPMAQLFGKGGGCARHPLSIRGAFFPTCLNTQLLPAEKRPSHSSTPTPHLVTVKLRWTKSRKGFFRTQTD